MSECIKTVQEIDDRIARSSALEELAVAQARAGQTDEALRTIGQIGDRHQKNWAIERVAYVEAEAGHHAKAKEIAAGKKEESSADRMLRRPSVSPPDFSAALARGGHFEDALSAAQDIKNKETRIYALAEIAICQAERGLVQPAVDTASSIKDHFWRARTLANIAENAP